MLVKESSELREYVRVRSGSPLTASGRGRIISSELPICQMGNIITNMMLYCAMIRWRNVLSRGRSEESFLTPLEERDNSPHVIHTSIRIAHRLWLTVMLRTLPCALGVGVAFAAVIPIDLTHSAQEEHWHSKMSVITENALVGIDTLLRN